MDILAAQRRRATLPFRTMLMIAFSVHLLSLGVWSALTHRLVDTMPTNVVEIRLGDMNEDLYENGVSSGDGGAAPEKDSPAAAALNRALEAPLPVRRVRAPAPVRLAPQGEPDAPAAQPDKTPSGGNEGAAARAPTPDKPAATAQSPTDSGMLRGRGKGGGKAGKGENYGNSDSSKATVAARYEQKLSAWLEGYRVFPREGTGGERGRVMVRVRIDRLGHVVSKYIEESSGIPGLDEAVLDQVARADPFPPTPLDYPGGAQLEFRFPVTLGRP